MDSVLLIGGSELNIDDVEDLAKDKVVIAVDSGYDNIVDYILPEYIIGDLDSIVSDIDPKVKHIPSIEIDDIYTDMEIAFKFLRKKGVKSISVLGALGGRVDHTLVNIQLLETYKDLNIEMLDNNNRITLGEGNTTIYKNQYKYLSIVPIYNSTTISIEGVKYPLKGHIINRGDSLTVSNEITEDLGMITTDKPVIIIQSK